LVNFLRLKAYYTYCRPGLTALSSGTQDATTRQRGNAVANQHVLPRGKVGCKSTSAIGQNFDTRIRAYSNTGEFVYAVTAAEDIILSSLFIGLKQR